MPKVINEFFKGDNRDVDVLKIPNDTARRLENMRIIDIEGKGMVLTNIGGTEQKFSITSGHVPIGNCEYNGVSYIASVNPDTSVGEIGCYPAPLSLVNEDCSQIGWDQTNKVYAPLFNFTGPNSPRDENVLSQVFRTELFNFSCENQIDMFAREDYDGSVSLYLAQIGNPTRVINTGFDQDGSCVSIGRRYWNNSFPNAVNLLHEAEIHLDVTFEGLGLAGNLKAGNWIFFARYSTENFDKTSFFTETNAIQITNGTYGSEGINHHGALGNKETDKSVNLTFSNIDPTYTYIEIGYIYNFDEGEEYGIIDKLYYLDPNQSTIDIEITGYEGVIPAGLQDIIKSKPRYDSASTHTQLENRYFAANLFDTTNFDNDAVDALLEFSRNITCSYDDTKQLTHRSGGEPVGIYNNEGNVYNYTGYFRGEAYAFGIVFVLNNGRETQAFPISGSDDFNGLGGTSNNNGIYRFPNINLSNTVNGNYVNVMGIKFDVSAAIAALPQYLEDNVSGFYIVRAERSKMLMYQGFVLPCYHSKKGNDPRWNIMPWLYNDVPKILKRTESVAPMFDSTNAADGASFPYVVRFDIDSAYDNEFTFVTKFRRFTRRRWGKWGFYSPDHFFNKSLGLAKAYVYPFADMVFSYFTNIDPSKKEYHYRDYAYNFSAQSGNVESISNIKEWEKATNDEYTSYFNEGAERDFNSMFYLFLRNINFEGVFFEMRNLPLAWSSYIGITSEKNLRYKLVNLYKGSLPPEDLDPTDLYDIKATSYYKISKFYRLKDIQDEPGIINNSIYYKGDCFLQRTWLKQLYNPVYGVGVQDDGGAIGNALPNNFLEAGNSIGERLFAFGVTGAIITENTINTEMRRDDFTNKFYPGNYDDPYDFAVKDIEKESELLNRGYNIVLSKKSYIGIDEDIPFFPEDKPVGIIYSNKHLPGSLQDGYRIIDLSAIKEYDYRMGHISSLKIFNNILVSIQEHGVNRHFVNEKAVLNQGSSTGELLLGTGDILDAKHLNISDFVGSQHQWSIVETDRGIYGVDFNKRKLWRLFGQLQIEIISDSKGYISTLHDLCEFQSSDSDISEQMPDNPVCNSGIVAHYDRKHNDIYFTWIYGNPELNSNIKEKGATIVFNEWMDSFHGNRTFNSPMYLSINEDFFSFNPDIFPSINSTPSGLGDVYIHDIHEISGVDNSTTFYQNVDADISYVEFIVNENSDFAKVFDNLEISSSPDDLYRAFYETQHQRSEHFPWISGGEANYWRDPVYKENLWKISIIRTEDIQEPTNNIYSVDSRFRGRWIKIRLEYKTKSSIFIKSILTSLRISYS